MRVEQWISQILVLDMRSLQVDGVYIPGNPALAERVEEEEAADSYYSLELRTLQGHALAFTCRCNNSM